MSQLSASLLVVVMTSLLLPWLHGSDDVTQVVCELGVLHDCGKAYAESIKAGQFEDVQDKLAKGCLFLQEYIDCLAVPRCSNLTAADGEAPAVTLQNGTSLQVHNNSDVSLHQPNGDPIKLNTSELMGMLVSNELHIPEVLLQQRAVKDGATISDYITSIWTQVMNMVTPDPQHAQKQQPDKLRRKKLYKHHIGLHHQHSRRTTTATNGTDKADNSTRPESGSGEEVKAWPLPKTWSYSLVATSMFLKTIKMCPDMDNLNLGNKTLDLIDFRNTSEGEEGESTKCFEAYPCYADHLDTIQSLTNTTSPGLCDAWGSYISCVLDVFIMDCQSSLADTYSDVLHNIWRPAIEALVNIPGIC